MYIYYIYVYIYLETDARILLAEISSGNMTETQI